MPTRHLTPAVQAETVADWNGLPYTRIEDHNGVAKVIVGELAHLERWFMALSGHITHQPTDCRLTLWTLHTDTDHGHGAPLQVHVLALDTDQIDDDCAHAVRPHTP